MIPVSELYEARCLLTNFLLARELLEPQHEFSLEPFLLFFPVILLLYCEVGGLFGLRFTTRSRSRHDRYRSWINYAQNSVILML